MTPPCEHPRDVLLRKSCNCELIESVRRTIKANLNSCEKEEKRMSKREFKPGDRVKFQWSNWNQPEIWHYGEIVKISGVGKITIKNKTSTFNDVTPCSVRRLKPKRVARAWEMMGTKELTMMISSHRSGPVVSGPALEAGERVKVREVIEKARAK